MKIYLMRVLGTERSNPKFPETRVVPNAATDKFFHHDLSMFDH